MANGEAYITGIGQSEVGVRLTRPPLLLTRDAVREALDESGLTLDQIDGVVTFPGKSNLYPGFSPVSSEDLIEGMGIRSRFQFGGMEQSAQLSSIAAAAMAVKTGLARHVLCFRTIYEAAGISRPDEFPPQTRTEIEGYHQWMHPFFAISAACWVAQYAMRHMHRYGMTREQLGQIAVNAYRNGVLNPRARAFAKEELTLDKYMAARPISAPFCLYDCDRFTDASTVIIVSAGDAIDEVKCQPVRIAAMAGSANRWSWDQIDEFSCYQTGRDLWSRTDFKPADVDVAQLYDGFSYFTLTWIEALGFAGKGEGHQFIEGGRRIALDGELPLNTAGGQIGAGRVHGYGFAHEAVTQLRKKGGLRQVPGDPKVAVACSGGGPLAAALLLTTH